MYETEKSGETVSYECAYCGNKWDHEEVLINGGPRVVATPQCPDCGSRATSPEAYNPF